MKRTAPIIGLIAAFAVGSVLALQGWKSRVPSLDLVPHLMDAEALVHHGVIPEKGCLSSFAAYIPPGPTWLFAPGIALELPGRLVEYPATLFLFALTCIGLFVLGNLCFEAPAGVCCAVVYAASDRGIFFASSLWPRGHPAFVVWFVVFLCLWVRRRRLVWLGAAIVAFAIGCYVFMEILPLAVALVMVWLRFRPPIKAVTVRWAAVVSLVVWFPYLQFQCERGGRDLRAILARTSLPLADPTPHFCDPGASIRNANGEVVWPKQDAIEARAPARNGWLERLRHVGVGLTENFGILPGTWAPWLALLGFGIALQIGRRHPGHDVPEQGVLWRVLLISWLLLLLIPEADAALSGRRFWWLWPLQIVAAVGTIQRMAKNARPPIAIVGLSFVALAFVTGAAVKRVEDWRTHGYSGADAEQWTICQRISVDCEKRVLIKTNVGYSVEVWAHAFQFRTIDPRYKLGMEWDWLLHYDFGLKNKIDCPEGVSVGADYEVVEKKLNARFPPKLANEERWIDGERYGVYRWRAVDN